MRRIALAVIALLAGSAQAGPMIAPSGPQLLVAAPAQARPSMEEPRQGGAFFVEEAALRAALLKTDQLPAAADALASFYERHGLYVEALAAIVEPSRPQARLTAARCAYALGRYERAQAILDDDALRRLEAAQIIGAMALARLGAFSKAGPILTGAGADDAPLGLRFDFAILRAEAFLRSGDYVSARDALGDAGAEPEVEFIRGKIRAASGDPGAARKIWTGLASGDGQIAARARLAIAAQDFATDEIDAAGMLWSGGVFEREWRQAQLKSSAALPERTIDAARRLVEFHPYSDEAASARSAIAQLLPTLFEANAYPPKVAARLFYENIDFAPPGTEGDRLIRDVAEKLAALDLLAQAAELLEHQTFNRLRGADRAAVALRLAEVYLLQQRPLEALRVIRSTRIAGLDAPLVAQRVLVEAQALEATGAHEAALQLLSAATDKDALTLKAQISWRRQDWPSAAQAYRRLAAASGARDAQARQAVLRAGAAYLKAGDDAGLAAFIADITPRLSGTSEGAILQSLSSDDGAAAFMAAYRAAFEPGVEGSI